MIPKLKKELAQAYYRVGSITADIGTPTDALVPSAGLQRCTGRFPRRPEHGILFRGELARVHRGIGRMESGTGNRPRPSRRSGGGRPGRGISRQSPAMSRDSRMIWPGLQQCRPAALHARRGGGEPPRFVQSIATWEGLVRDHRDPDFRAGLGQAYSNYGWLLCTAGQLDGAIDTTRKAVEILEAEVRVDGTVAINRSRLSDSLDNLGVMYFYADRRLEAGRRFGRHFCRRATCERTLRYPFPGERDPGRRTILAICSPRTAAEMPTPALASRRPSIGQRG